MKAITLQEVKDAMRNIKFRLSLPAEFKEDIQKYESNPGCPCNLPIYQKVIRKAKKQLQEYYPDATIAETPEMLYENNFEVINCSATDLENKLKALPMGRKQIAVARYEDQVTVIVNHLSY